MRFMALAGVVLLLGTSVAWAQTQPQQTTSGPTGATSSASPVPSSSGAAAAAQAVISASGSSSGGSTNPLAGATAASPGVSQATAASQNSASAVQGFLVTTDGLQIPVFGTELFTGTFAGTRPADRPDYNIQPGDQIVVNLYGAINNGGTQTVDATGNVFIVGVGPVHVSGVPAGQIQTVISGAVRQVFTTAVGVYATVGSAGSIGVYVAGDVNRPGRYIGGARDPVMFYLSQAGGVDAARGSLRNVTVRRGGQVVASYDLYDFLFQGQVPTFHFQDGDVIFVGQRGIMVGATGDVRNGYAFEAPQGSRTLTGADVLPLARPISTVTGVVVHGYRNGTIRAAYFSIQDFARVVLADGDRLEFRSGSFVDSVTVSVQGQIRGPLIYVLPRGATLGQLMAQIPLENTDVEARWVHVQRPEVAAEQKRAINDALFNLQREVLTSAPATNSAAQLATAQATLVNQFVAQAQTAAPDGNIAVYSDGVFRDLRLQDGDVVVLPNRTDVVIVAGEVLNPGGLAHAGDLTIEGYIDRAGGFASHANKKKFVLRHRDGSAIVARPEDRPLPGDEIVVLPNIGNSRLQVFSDLATLFFQLALTTATVARL